MSNTVNSAKMMADEAEQILARRKAIAERDIAAQGLHPEHYLGLAFSGCGIRSGTFNLGILQGLSRIGLLPYVDFLSTVSGGGYIGSWLHGVIKRHGAPGTGPLEEILKRPDCAKHLPAEEDPIAFLRKYSSYLAPDMGLFSADFWVILVIWFRNMMLNQLMLIPFLGLFALLTFHLGILRQNIFGGPDGAHAQLINPVAILIVVLLLLVVLVAGTGVRNVVSPTERRLRENLPPSRFDQAKYAVACAALMMTAAVVLASSARSAFGETWSPEKYAVACLALFFLFFCLQALGGFLGCYRDRHPRNRALRWLWLILFPAAAAAATAALLLVTVDWMGSWSNSWCVIAYGPPLVGFLWIAGAGIHIGLMAADFPDSGREWFARVGAFLSVFLVAWSALFTICVFTPLWLSKLPGVAVQLGLTGAWAATTAMGVLSGISSKTSGQSGEPQKSKVLEFIGQIAPAVFVTGLMVLISFGVVETINLLMRAAPLPNFQATQWRVLTYGAREAILLTAALAAIVALLPTRININEFSMHYFYKNRLVRCYLGASRQRRNPSRLTGFDSNDDFQLAKLVPTNKAEPYFGPYPIICATLNLNVGSELAKRERRGTSFIFTPLYSGYCPPRSAEDRRQQALQTGLEESGFRPTFGYSTPDGLDIGTCMGISGAAANPNWGYHTSGAVAFLLTVFDVRLGWWIGNSRRARPSEKIGPTYALLPLLSELFAQTDQRSAFLNLSDGGHFENLGLYELVRRRCRYIIAGDGEQDSNLTFESLGGAIRKCRVDFGVNIDLNPRPITLKSGSSSTHCVVSKIIYPPDPQHPNPNREGWILYLKSSITGDEPEDVAQYKSVHPDFPQETTANQFFTESQFESYRRLGLHVVQSAFGNVTGCGCLDGGLTEFQARMQQKLQNPANWMEHLFRCLEQQWYPPTDIPETVKSHHAEAYTALLNRLSADPDLRYLDAQVICAADADLEQAVTIAPPPVADEKIDRKAFFYCLELIQLMENVWADLRFYEAQNRENPKNGGWLTIFRFWARQPIFTTTWDRAAYTFNPLFQQFFTTIRNQPVQKKEADCAAMPAVREPANLN